jgi:hypothetical protein
LLTGCVDQLSQLSILEQKLDMGISKRPISLTSYAKQIGGKIESPTFETVQSDGVVEISGTIQQYQQLATPYVWIQIEYTGKKALLPKIFNYYPEVTSGSFAQQATLFAGIGEYKVRVYAPGHAGDRSFYLFSQFEVHNDNPDIHADVAYSLHGVQQGLQLKSSLRGYQFANGSIRLEGTIADQYAGKEVLVQVSKEKQKWQKVVLVNEEAAFVDIVPLLYGQGLHQIEILLPDEQKADYFIDGAKLYVENQTKDSRSPIVYSTLYEQRGIHLTTPIAGGGQGEYEYPIQGYIDPNAKLAEETDHLIIQTKKEGLLATYFIPIENYHFDDVIPLRFGSGEYEVIVYVPEITTTNRDYFRFFMVAKFHVTSIAAEDKRDLLPSRGITPTHPTIVALAKTITADATSDYKRAKLIYRYVAKQMTYDVNKFHNNSFAWDDGALKSLQIKKGVCQDYVFLTLSLLRALDIRSRFVEGVAGGQNHAWVEVRIDDRWLIMDPTWGSGFIDPEKGFIKRYSDKYFDISAEKLSKTHKKTGIVY